MLRAGEGLVPVQTDHLLALLRAVHRGEVQAPLDIAGLTRVGLQRCAEDLLAHLRGLDAAGLRAVLVAVIAERRAPR